MTLPIHKIIWAKDNAAHYNHLHVEGIPYRTGTPPLHNPGMTPAIETIYLALTAEFGPPRYNNPHAEGWSNLGVYNRRKIAGTNVWSQHAWSNALDIGPYLGVAQQQKFYDFLTNYDDGDDDMPLNDQDRAEIRAIVREELDRRTDGRPGPANSFRGVGEAVVSTAVGATGPNGNPPPWTIGQYLRRTYDRIIEKT